MILAQHRQSRLLRALQQRLRLLHALRHAAQHRLAQQNEVVVRQLTILHHALRLLARLHLHHTPNQLTQHFTHNRLLLRCRLHLHLLSQQHTQARQNHLVRRHHIHILTQRQHPSHHQQSLREADKPHCRDSFDHLNARELDDILPCSEHHRHDPRHDVHVAAKKRNNRGNRHHSNHLGKTQFLRVAVANRGGGVRLNLRNHVAPVQEFQIRFTLRSSEDKSQAPGSQRAVIVRGGQEQLIEHGNVRKRERGSVQEETVDGGVQRVARAEQNTHGFGQEGGDDGGNAGCRILDGVLEFPQKEFDLLLLVEGGVGNDLEQALKQTRSALANHEIGRGQAGDQIPQNSVRHVQEGCGGVEIQVVVKKRQEHSRIHQKDAVPRHGQGRERRAQQHVHAILRIVERTRGIGQRNAVTSRLRWFDHRIEFLFTVFLFLLLLLFRLHLHRLLLRLVRERLATLAKTQTRNHVHHPRAGRFNHISRRGGSETPEQVPVVLQAELLQHVQLLEYVP